MSRFKKGYTFDAGTDIYVDETAIVPPRTVMPINLKCNITPRENTCAFIVPRSSAAKRGILIANCPVDTDYNGDVWAMVFNTTDTPITLNAGESFCQYVICQITTGQEAVKETVEIKKEGRRTNGAFGSTDVKN